MKYFGYSFNSVRPAELFQAQDLLLKCKPHLFRLTSLAADAMRDGAWLAMAWVGDAVLLARENPAIRYVLGEEGGELWCDYYAVTAESQQLELAHALIDYLYQPERNAREALAHGYPTTDRRANALLPATVRGNSVMFPPASALRALEFGAPETLTEPLRAEILARFKTA